MAEELAGACKQEGRTKQRVLYVVTAFSKSNIATTCTQAYLIKRMQQQLLQRRDAVVQQLGRGAVVHDPIALD